MRLDDWNYWNDWNVWNDQSHVSFVGARIQTEHSRAAASVDTDGSRRTAGGDFELDGLGRADNYFYFGAASSGTRRAGGLGDVDGKFFLSARCGSGRRRFSGARCRASRRCSKHRAGRREAFALRRIRRGRARSRRCRYSHAAADSFDRSCPSPSYGTGLSHQKRKRGVFFGLIGFAQGSRQKETGGGKSLYMRFARPQRQTARPHLEL